jgi:hypothetical protein
VQQSGYLQVSFVLRFWLEETDGSQSWRGRVVEVSNQAETHVHDEAGLLQFISRELLRIGGVELPHRRQPSTQ